MNVTSATTNTSTNKIRLTTTTPSVAVQTFRQSHQEGTPVHHRLAANPAGGASRLGNAHMLYVIHGGIWVGVAVCEPDRFLLTNRKTYLAFIWKTSLVVELHVLITYKV